MRTLKISDELYEQLKSFIVDPFDDTPDVVIARLIEIARKAQNRWSPLDAQDPPRRSAPPAAPPQREHSCEPEEQEVIL